MTLEQLLASLQNAEKIVVTVINGSDNKELVKFYASGYEQILASILAQDVAKLTVVGATAITVVVGEISA